MDIHYQYPCLGYVPSSYPWLCDLPCVVQKYPKRVLRISAAVLMGRIKATVPGTIGCCAPRWAYMDHCAILWKELLVQVERSKPTEGKWNAHCSVEAAKNKAVQARPAPDRAKNCATDLDLCSTLWFTQCDASRAKVNTHAGSRSQSNITGMTRI